MLSAVEARDSRTFTSPCDSYLTRLGAAINVDKFRKEKPAEILKRLKEAHRRREDSENNESESANDATVDLAVNGEPRTEAIDAWCSTSDHTGC